MEIRLEGRTAIVTGSSQGIGLACAVLLAEGGAGVVMNSHRKDSGIEEEAEKMRGRGLKVKAVIADVSERKQAQKLVDAGMEWGGADILVNNAGGLVKRLPVSDFDDEHYQKVMDINVKTAFLMSHLVIPQMKKRKSGAIVNLSSLAAHDGGGDGSAVYSASKAAVWTFTKSLAKELGPFGIRVNCVSPGFIEDTLFHKIHSPKERFDAMRSAAPLKRNGKSIDVAHAVLFLVSDMAAYITGQTLEVNGGLYLF